MERKKDRYMKYLFLLVFIGFSNLLTGQVNYCYFKETYAAGNMDGWEKEIRKIEGQHSRNFEVMANTLTARYGYMGYLLGKKENSKVRSLLDETEKLLEDWLKKRPGNSRLLGIKAGLVGFRIGLSPMRAPFLGQRNLDAYEEAIKNNPSEPMGWLEKGNSMFHRPSMFGGDKMEAENAFRKALQLAKADDCDWLYSFLQVRLYEACKANGKTAEAEAIKKQLQQKPGHFRWIDSL
jgi:hypothetical protein